MVLQHFDERLPSDGGREVLARQLDTYVGGQFVDAAELALAEEFSVELGRSLRQVQNSLEARFENQLRKFVVNFECFLNPRVVQMREALVDHLYRCRFLQRWALDLDLRRPAAELVPVVGQENLLRGIYVTKRFE